MYKFSEGLFFPYALMSRYIQSGSWPVDGVDVNDDIFAEYNMPRDGKVVGADENGMPCWMEAVAPKPTFAQALSSINSLYVKDRDELCAAWLRAAVADGVEESSRKEDVESELAELDAKHAIDVENLKSEYGVT